MEYIVNDFGVAQVFYSLDEAVEFCDYFKIDRSNIVIKEKN